MYSLLTPSPAKFNELSRAFNTFLVENKVDMIDRRNCTAFVLAKVIGGSLPVSDVATSTVAQKAWRDMHLPTVKAYVGRLAEAILVDVDLIVLGVFHEWTRRCNEAFPAAPAFSDSMRLEPGQETVGAFLPIVEKYPDLKMGWTVTNLLVSVGS